MLGPKQAGFFQYKIADLVFDKIIIKQARKVHLILLKRIRTFENKSHGLLKENFIINYSRFLDDLKLI